MNRQGCSNDVQLLLTDGTPTCHFYFLATLAPSLVSPVVSHMIGQLVGLEGPRAQMLRRRLWLEVGRLLLPPSSASVPAPAHTLTTMGLCTPSHLLAFPLQMLGHALTIGGLLLSIGMCMKYLDPYREQRALVRQPASLPACLPACQLAGQLAGRPASLPASASQPASLPAGLPATLPAHMPASHP